MEFFDSSDDSTISVPKTEQINSNFRTQSASVEIMCMGDKGATAAKDAAFFSGETVVEENSDDEADGSEGKS